MNTGGCPLHNPEQPDIESRKKKMLIQQEKKGQGRMKERTGNWMSQDAEKQTGEVADYADSNRTMTSQPGEQRK